MVHKQLCQTCHYRDCSKDHDSDKSQPHQICTKCHFSHKSPNRSPAYYTTCSKGHRRNHWAVWCFSHTHSTGRSGTQNNNNEEAEYYKTTTHNIEREAMTARDKLQSISIKLFFSLQLGFPQQRHIHYAKVHINMYSSIQVPPTYNFNNDT